MMKTKQFKKHPAFEFEFEGHCPGAIPLLQQS